MGEERDTGQRAGSVYANVCCAKEKVKDVFEKHLVDCTKLKMQATLIQSCKEEVEEVMGELVGLIPPDKEVEDFLFLPSDDVLALRHYTSDLKVTLSDYKERLTRTEKAYKDLFQRLNKRDTIIDQIRATLYKEVCQLRGKLAGRIDVATPTQIDIFDVYNQLELEIEEVHQYYASLFEQRDLQDKRQAEKVVNRYRTMLSAKDKDLISKQVEYRNATQRLDSDHNKLLEELHQENIRMRDQAEVLQRNLRIQMEEEFAIEMKATLSEVRRELDEEIADLQESLQQSNDTVDELAEQCEALKEQIYVITATNAKMSEHNKKLIHQLQIEYDIFISDYKEAQTNAMLKKERQLAESRRALEEFQVRAEAIERSIRAELAKTEKQLNDLQTELQYKTNIFSVKIKENDAELFCLKEVVRRTQLDHAIELLDVRAVNTKLEAHLVQSKAEITALRQDLTRSQLNAGKRRRSSVVEAEAMVAEYNQAYEGHNDIIEAAQQRFDREREEYMRKLQELEAEKADLLGEIWSLELELRKAQQTKKERWSDTDLHRNSTGLTQISVAAVEDTPSKDNRQDKLKLAVKKKEKKPSFRQRKEPARVPGVRRQAKKKKVPKPGKDTQQDNISEPDFLSLPESPFSAQWDTGESSVFNEVTLNEPVEVPAKLTSASDDEEELVEVVMFNRILRKNLWDFKARVLQEGDSAEVLRNGKYLTVTILCFKDTEVVVRPRDVYSDEVTDFAVPRHALRIEEGCGTPKTFPAILQSNKELRKELVLLKLQHPDIENTPAQCSNDLDFMDANIDLLNMELVGSLAASIRSQSSHHSAMSLHSPTTPPVLDIDVDTPVQIDIPQLPMQMPAKHNLTGKPVWDRILKRAEGLSERLGHLREAVLEQRTKELMATNPLWMKESNATGSDNEWLPSRVTTATPYGSRPASQLRTSRREMSPFEKEQAEWMRVMMTNAIDSDVTRKGGGFCRSGAATARTPIKRPNTAMGVSRCATPPAPFVRPASAEPGTHRRYTFKTAREAMSSMASPIPLSLSPPPPTPPPSQNRVHETMERAVENRAAGGKHTLNTGRGASPGLVAPCYPVLPPGGLGETTINITAYNDGKVDVVSTAAVSAEDISEFAQVMVERFGKTRPETLPSPSPPPQSEAPNVADNNMEGKRVPLQRPSLATSSAPGSPRSRNAAPRKPRVPSFAAPRIITPSTPKPQESTPKKKFIPEQDANGKPMSPRFSAPPRSLFSNKPYAAERKAHVIPNYTSNIKSIT